jgi:SAM-dependent methyltransferase
LSAQISDADVAALYGVLNPWGASDDFYLDLAANAAAVLDVGCGTGTLLHRVRETGHKGRLCGIDPDDAALELARRRNDVEWISSNAATMAFSHEFELALMAGHAFQFLVTDDDVRQSLTAIRHALLDGGRFVFDTRNPTARSWEQWNPENAIDVVHPAGRGLRVWHEVEDVSGEVFTITETTADSDGAALRVDRAKLRFFTVDELEVFLADADFQIEAQYGGFSREPLEPFSSEIVTVAATA